MGRQLGSFADEDELDRPDLNKCPDCGCFFADLHCPLCGRECPEAFRAGNRRSVRHTRRRTGGSSGRVTFIEWYHSWWFIIAMMILFPILGIILLFTSPHKKSAKITVLTVAVVYTVVTSYGFFPMVSRLWNAFDHPVDQKLSREEYVAACAETDPETFYRSPDAFRGEFTRMEVTVIAKVVDSEGYYGGERYYTYYVVQNAAGNIRFLLRDCQREGAQNLLTGDTVTVYGEGAGNVSFFGMDGTPYSAPCLNVAFLSRMDRTV